jgi:hypothetical protein
MAVDADHRFALLKVVLGEGISVSPYYRAFLALIPNNPGWQIFGYRLIEINCSSKNRGLLPLAAAANSCRAKYDSPAGP